MSLTVHASPGIARVGGDVRLIPVGDHLWRVVDATGRALGHLQQRGDDARARFAARRFHAASGGFRDAGEFCRPDEAIECLRLSR